MGDGPGPMFGVIANRYRVFSVAVSAGAVKITAPEASWISNVSEVVRSDVVSVASAGRVSFSVFALVFWPGPIVPILCGELIPAFGTVTYTVSAGCATAAFNTV